MGNIQPIHAIHYRRNSFYSGLHAIHALDEIRPA
jgi:hypothetical protein